MARMLMPALSGLDDLDTSINNNTLHPALVKMISIAAVENMKKCIVVDLFDNLHHDTPSLLADHFPWMCPPKKLPRLRQRRLAYYKFQTSHIEEIEELNALDQILFDAALREMRLQRLNAAV